jgi:hypothetical protein
VEHLLLCRVQGLQLKSWRLAGVVAVDSNRVVVAVLAI